MEPLRELAAVQLAEQSDVGWLDGAEALAGGRWLLDQRLGDLAAWRRELVVLDDALRPVWRLRPPPEPDDWRGTHAVADDLSLAALALPREMRLVAPDGRVVVRLPYPTQDQAGSADFTTAGTLYVRFPGRHELLELTADLEVVNRHRAPGIGEAGGCLFTADRRWLWVCVPSVGEVGCALWLVRVAGKRVVSRHPLDALAQVVRFYRHPDGHSVCLAVSGGADSHAEFWARHEDERIMVWPPPGPGRLTAIHPGGQEYLTAPGWEEPQELTRRRWPDGLVLARLPLAAVAPSGEGLGDAHYLTGELVLTTVALGGGRGEPHLVCSRAPLRPLGWVRYPGTGRIPPGILGPCQDGAWLTLDSNRTSTTVRRWALAEPPTPAADQTG